MANEPLRLSSISQGVGSPPLLFIHGIGGDHSHFDGLTAKFSKSHRVVAVDLRGHGKSDKPNQGYTVGQMALDVLEVCRELGIRGAIAVGHSLGGFIALEMAVKARDVLQGVVMLDMPAFFPQEVEKSMRPVVEALNGSDYSNALRAFASQAFFHPADNLQRKEELLNMLCRLPREVFLPLFSEMATYDVSAAARAAAIPLLYIHGITPTNVIAFRDAYVGLNTAQVALAGHYIHVEVPEQVIPMIQRFIAKGSFQVVKI